MEKFIHYQKELNLNRYPPSVLEDEIFSLCVLDKSLVDSIDYLPAGTISTVAGNILSHSGPSNVDDFNRALDIARVNTSDIIYSSIDLICRVFPTYTPEDILAMDFEKLTMRLAMAERRLLQTKVLVEPITFFTGEQPPVEKVIPNKAEEFAKKLADLNAKQPPKPMSKKTIITKGDEMESIMAVSGHERQDYAILQKEALQGIEHIYPEYFKMMREGQKLTPDKIKTPEERKKDYEENVRLIREGKSRPAIDPVKPPEPKARRRIKRKR